MRLFLYYINGIDSFDEWGKLNGLKVFFMKLELYLRRGVLIWISKS